MFLKFKRNNPGKDTGTDATDETLVIQYLQTGNKELIGELFNRYTHLVYGICLNYLNNEDQCKDAVMEIFESLFQKLTEHRIINFRNWLYTVSKNYCLMQFRKKGSFNRLLEYIRNEYDESEHPYELQDDESVNEIGLLGTAVEQLKNEQETCIKLMYMDRKTYKDISMITGYSMNEVKSYIQNGKRNLRNIIMDMKDESEK